MTTTSSSANPSGSGRALAAILGIVLLIPALAWGYLTLFQPTVQTLQLSLQKFNGLQPPVYIGFDNYNRLFSDPAFGAALGFTFKLIGARVLAVAIVPLVLALLVNEFGRALRIPVRLLLSIPVAIFAPVLTWLSWRLAFNPVDGLFGGPPGPSALASVQGAPNTLVSIDALTTFGLACGVGLIVYLIALRGTGAENPSVRQVWKPLLVVWLASVAIAIATGLQSFGLSYSLTNGGPGSSTATLAMYQYRASFLNLQLGYAAAVASLIFVLLGLLGLLIGLVVVLTGVELFTVPWGGPFGFMKQRKAVVGLILFIGLVLVGIVIYLDLQPIVWALLKGLNNADALGTLKVPPDTLLANSINPVIPAVLIQVPILYLAGLGIGACRPFGRFSGLLLLLFSPWLFVSFIPLSITYFQNVRAASNLDTLQALSAEPGLLSVAILFVLTLFFKGQTNQWRQRDTNNKLTAFFQTVILPSVPFMLLLVGVQLAVGFQDYFGALILTHSPSLLNAPVSLLGLSATLSVNTNSLASAVAYFGMRAFVVALIPLALFQIFYFDRLSLGRVPDRAATPV